ncbi:hypothetical protein [Hydrogenophaga sp.]|uniref:PIN domain-containing protein n=1 Tax=Hydrogenophaga sp. TaxID=1904254 RepID=UPI0026374E2E|nr:hypothetical protein [Hydrogenophaga sp.]
MLVKTWEVPLAVNNDLQRPVDDGDFEALCLQLYSRMWNVTGLMRVGRGGQAQFGVDILGHDGRQSVGIQCKHYVSTKFTYATVTSDVAEADAANLAIQHLIFATTAPAKAEVVRSVHELSERRRATGKFTVSVEYWNTICDHIRMHPDVGRAFIPGFPGGTLLAVSETVVESLTFVREIAAKQDLYRQEMLDAVAGAAVSKSNVAPDARGDEADPGVVASLDFIRDRMREGKTADAKQLLQKLGDPSAFKDEFSKFRWTTNMAAIAMLEGDEERAAEGFLKAYTFAPEDEKAYVNRIHAYFMRKKFEAADIACDEALEKFPDSSALWAISLHTRNAVGRETLDAEVPEAALKSSEFLFAKSRLLGKQGACKASIDLLQQCIALDGGSLDARRALLAEALTWASADPLAALMGQLPPEQRTALQDALDHFEPLEQVLPAQQAEKISEELATNLVSSLLILDQKPRARRLSHQMLSRHPQLEQLLRTHVMDLAERKDFVALHVIADGQLDVLPGSVLAMLAEISAYEGDVAWNSQIISVIERRAGEDEKLPKALPLAFLAAWHHGDKTEALAGVQAHLKLHPADMLAGVMQVQFLKDLGRRSEALAAAHSLRDRLSVDSLGLEALYVADLMFDLKQYEEAAPIYERLVPYPGGGELTWKLLACYIQTDQRWRAQRIFDALAPSMRSQSDLRRLEIKLAGIMGDWARMRVLLEQELAADPTSAECILGCADVLFRLGEREALTAFVATDPVLKSAGTDQELSFARLQMNCGFGDLAVARLFRVFRAHPTNERLAGHFLGQLMLAQNLTLFDPPKVVGPGTAVQLKQGDEQWAIAIDTAGSQRVETWSDLVQPDSDIAVRLAGLQLGQRTIVRRGIFDEEVEVVGISTLVAFAAEKAQALVTGSANAAGPIWSIRIVKEDGGIDVDVLLRSAKQRREHVEQTFHLYSQHALPLCVLAKLIGTDPIQLLLEWPWKLTPLFVGVGSEDERQNAFAILQGGRQRYVADLLTIAELIRLGVAPAVSAVIGRPLVAQTQREHLLVIMAGLGEPRESSSLSEQDGRLRLVDVPSWYYKRRRKLLEAVLAFVDSSCEVVPTTGPQVVTNLHRSLARTLDRSTLDTLYLCVEHNAVLLSEDGGLRMLAVEAGVAASMGVQPVLMQAVDTGKLSHQQYVDALEIKLLANHNFVSVAAMDLLLMARKTPNRIAPAAAAVFQSFRKATLDFESGVKVSGEFIRIAAATLPAATLGRYTKAILEALQHGRPRSEKVLVRYFSRQVRPFFGRNGRRLAPHIRREFGAQLLRRR